MIPELRAAREAIFWHHPKSRELKVLLDQAKLACEHRNWSKVYYDQYQLCHECRDCGAISQRPFRESR